MLHVAESASLQIHTLQAIVNDPLMRNSAVLVFANKQDMVRQPEGCRSWALTLVD